MTDKKVRVRFAASPTGKLKPGGVLIAIVNLLFAKENKGEFILRIDDLQKEFNAAGAEEDIKQVLKKFNIHTTENADEEGKLAFYKQSERRDIYRKYADELIASGWAYYDFETTKSIEKIRSEYKSKGENFFYDQHTRGTRDNSTTLSEEETQERIERGDPFVIRFKMPADKAVDFRDLSLGETILNTSHLNDAILIGYNGTATYHLANVVDDYLMQISHVIRSEEWFPSLPLHLMLYKALGWENETPKFAHLNVKNKNLMKNDDIWTEEENDDRALFNTLSKSKKTCRTCYFCNDPYTGRMFTCGFHIQNFTVESWCSYYAAKDNIQILSHKAKKLIAKIGYEY